MLPLENYQGKPLKTYSVRCWNNGDPLGSEFFMTVRATSAEDAELDAFSTGIEEFDHYEASED